MGRTAASEMHLGDVYRANGEIRYWHHQRDSRGARGSARVFADREKTEETAPPAWSVDSMDLRRERSSGWQRMADRIANASEVTSTTFLNRAWAQAGSNFFRSCSFSRASVSDAAFRPDRKNC